LGADVSICRAKGLEVHEMDQNFMTFADESFDVLWSRHVLERSIAPMFTLSEYRRLTKAGGFLYIEVPAPDTSAHHERETNIYSALSPGAWQSLFMRAGFKILRGQRHAFTAPSGDDAYYAFWLRKPDVEGQAPA
jgi:SAM-dependent methyltransferase